MSEFARWWDTCEFVEQPRLKSTARAAYQAGRESAEGRVRELEEALEAQGWEYPPGEWHIPSCPRRNEWEWGGDLDQERSTCISRCAAAGKALTTSQEART